MHRSIMTGYIVRCPLLLVVLFAAAAMAMAKVPAASSTEQTTTTTPASTDDEQATTTPSSSSLQTPALADIPPYPAPADLPPCMNELMPCAQVYQDSSMLGTCCAAVEKVFDNDRKCLCDMMAEAMKNLDKLNITAADGVDGKAMFTRCKNMSGKSCDDVKGTAGSQKTGNSVPNARSIGAFQILLLLPLFFML